jgi:hypothetical protein
MAAVVVEAAEAAAGEVEVAEAGGVINGLIISYRNSQ